MEPDQIAQAILVHAASMDRIADALVALQAARTVAPVGPPAGNGGPPGGAAKSDKTLQQKMAGKVFAVCKTKGWDIADVGQRALGRPIDGDSRTWTETELKAVLEAFKDWGV